MSVCARIYGRFRRFSHLFWDDAFVVLAWACSIVLAAQVTVSSSEAASGRPKTSLFTSRVIMQLFFYTCLWSIKFSFLILFKRLIGITLRGLNIYWKAVTGFTILAYFVLWAMNPYECYRHKGVRGCEGGPSIEHLKLITFNVVCALDIITDCLSTAHPPIVSPMK